LPIGHADADLSPPRDGAIRPVAADDAEAIADFFSAAHALDPVIGAITAEDWLRFVAAPQNRGGRDFRIALAEGEIVGVATPSLRDHETPWIRHFRIVVAPALRRHGIGSALLQDLALMDAPHPARLQCLCPERWEATADFLEARGFAVLEHELDMVCEDAGRDEPRRRHDIAVRVLADKAAIAGALAAIHNRAYAGTASFVRHSDAEMLALLEAARVLVAERRGVPLGFCHLEPAGNASWIESVAVDPREQGRGIGALLMEHALAEAARRAGPRVRLAVSDRNAAAYALYRRLGFTVAGKSARYRADREAVLARLPPP
jgi:ribosomal protein S18 acetylase RimI-like enzyme